MCSPNQRTVSAPPFQNVRVFVVLGESKDEPINVVPRISLMALSCATDPSGLRCSSSKAVAIEGTAVPSS